jgi:hypothetical protein
MIRDIEISVGIGALLAVIVYVVGVMYNINGVSESGNIVLLMK